MEELLGPLKYILKFIMTDFQIEVFQAVLYALVVGIVYSEWRYKKKYKAQYDKIEELKVTLEEVRFSFESIRKALTDLRVLDSASTEEIKKECQKIAEKVQKSENLLHSLEQKIMLIEAQQKLQQGH